MGNLTPAIDHIIFLQKYRHLWRKLFVITGKLKASAIYTCDVSSRRLHIDSDPSRVYITGLRERPVDGALPEYQE